MIERVKRKLGDREGGSWYSPWDLSCPRIFRRAEVFVLVEDCLPRRPHEGQPRSDV